MSNPPPLTNGEPAGPGGDTRERILDAAEELLRRFGPAKTTVSDVARRLGMSHANVYRHFASKAALRDAVARRWLTRVSAPLEAIAAEEGPAAERLERWLLTLVGIKRAKVLNDPEMFATYHALALEARAVTEEHVRHLKDQIARILGDGVAEGAFRLGDLHGAAAAVLNATLRYHHPQHVRDTADAPEAEIRALLRLLLAGLAAGVV